MSGLILPRRLRHGLVLPQSQRGFMVVRPSRFGVAANPTVLLMHMNGTGSAFVEETGKSCTAYGGATQSTAWAGIDTKSMDNTTGGRVEVADSTDFDFGTGPFCIEWREYRTSNSGYQNPWSRGYNVAGGMSMQSDSPNSNDRNIYFMDPAGVAQAVCFVGNGTVLNTGVAWAVERDAAGAIRVFKNGAQIATAGPNANTQLSLGLRAPFVVGADSASSYWLRGYIDEFRVRRDAPYTAAGYTPATVPFTYP